jgi:hypothetical protein
MHQHLDWEEFWIAHSFGQGGKTNQGENFMEVHLPVRRLADHFHQQAKVRPCKVMWVPWPAKLYFERAEIWAAYCRADS